MMCHAGSSAGRKAQYQPTGIIAVEDGGSVAGKLEAELNKSPKHSSKRLNLN